MIGLDLFSGIGGISLALKPYVRTRVYCEIEPYCQSVLLQRMQEGHLCQAPIWDDIRTLTAKGVAEVIEDDIDIIFGGFPCQDISVAGAGKGLAGERSGLFFEVARLCSEIRPTFVFLENVPAITVRGGLDVVGTLTKMGYDCRWCIISAASVGAMHKRERWFLLAHSKHNGASSSKGGGSIAEVNASREQQKQKKDCRETERTGCLSAHVADTNSAGLQETRTEQQTTGITGESIESRKEISNSTLADSDRKRCEEQSRAEPIFSRLARAEYGCDDVADTMCQGLERQRERTQSIEKEITGFTCNGNESKKLYWPFESREHWQEIVSSMDKCTDGLPYMVDRLKSLGNSVVPQQCRKAFEILIGVK